MHIHRPPGGVTPSARAADARPRFDLAGYSKLIVANHAVDSKPETGPRDR